MNWHIPLDAIPVEHEGHDRDAICLSLTILAHDAPWLFDLLVDAVIVRIQTIEPQETQAA